LIVIDASTVLELLLQGSASQAIGDRLFRRGESLHAPHLLDLEVAQVIRRYWLAGELAPARGQEVIEDLSDLAIQRYAHRPLLPRIWDLRHNVTAYDAAYLALGEALDAPVLTRDVRLASAPGHIARVEIL
jgi:predicted nucleic acid-binding protein